MGSGHRDFSGILKMGPLVPTELGILDRSMPEIGNFELVEVTN